MEILHQPEDVISDRYRIIYKLGQGGIGITYKAEDLTNHKFVAIKVVLMRQVNDWKVLELFEREAKVLANLNHPAIPQYLDYFYLDDNNDRRFYLVQELVKGNSLADLVQQGWHPQEDKVKNIAIQVLEILHYLHKLTPPIIHRDIKPQNIIYCANEQVYLVDFGTVQDVYRNTVSLGGTFVGTFGYMPPEQFRGKTVFASDLYSLGTTILFLLTHRSPADLPQKRMKINFRSRISISEYFADWLEKMIEPAQEDRFLSAEEALQRLKQQQNIISLSTGNRILLRKDHRRLLVKIAPAGWGLNTFGVMFLTTVWYIAALISGSLFFTSTWEGDLNSVGFLFFLFLILSIGVGLVLTLGVLWQFYGQTFIEIKPNQFQIIWKSIGIKERKYGRTADISRVEISNDLHYKENNLNNCTLWHGVKKYHFGDGLTLREREWLVSEISSFLEELQS